MDLVADFSRLDQEAPGWNSMARGGVLSETGPTQYIPSSLGSMVDELDAVSP